MCEVLRRLRNDELETDNLEFIQKYSLEMNPMEIDVVIKKEEKRVIKKSIGKIFRKHNIMAYKNLVDCLSIDDYYKVFGYAYLYIAECISENEALPEELTISRCLKVINRSFSSIWKIKVGVRLQRSIREFTTW